MQLPDDIYQKLTFLSSSGDSFFENGDLPQALQKYQEALGLLPDPKAQWEAAAWLHVAMGDVYYNMNQYRAASENFHNAFNSSGMVDNPFINLRIGQCLFELGDVQKAENYLLRAYKIEGKVIFQGENKKYFEFLKSKAGL